MLRSGESRSGDFGRQSFYGDARFSCDCVGHENRERPVGHISSGLHQRIQLHVGAAGNQEPGAGRNFWRGIRNSRIH